MLVCVPVIMEAALRQDLQNHPESAPKFVM